MKIKDLTVGQRASLDLVLSECSIRKTKGVPPRDFLAATFTDGVDKLDGKIWNYSASQGVPDTKKVYTLEGMIGEYQGKKQITLDKMQLSSDQSVMRFEPMYCENVQGIYDDCLKLIEAMDPGNLKRIVSSLYSYYKTELLNATGAKGIHHVGHGGNLVHSYEVAFIGMHIADALSTLGYSVNKDLVVAGALLHDLGKCWSYDISGAVIDMSRHGRELEHIILGIMKLDEYLHDTELYDCNEAYALRHIIASHHGELEYGSPTTPCFMEAYIVNYADKVSADMNVLKQANDKAIAEFKEYTDKIFVLHNREHILQKNVLGGTTNG